MPTNNPQVPPLASSGLSVRAGSDRSVVRNAGMEIEDGLAWLQSGQLLIDGTDAPPWMHDLNGVDVACAANAIRQNARSLP